MRTEALLEAILDGCRRLHAQGLLAAADGNVSARLEDGRIAITPRGVPKAELRRQDFAFLELDGTLLRGTPSSERAMHLAIYRAVPAARAVVHAHPIHAIAWSLAHPDAAELPSEALPEVILAAGRIPVVPLAIPGTEAMGANLRPLLPDHRLMILARHGGLAWGESLGEALGGMERLEQVARILQVAEASGGARPMAPTLVAAHRELREQLGPRVI